MPNHTPEHMQRLTEASATKRRTKKISELIQTAPPIPPDQGEELRDLVQERMDAYVAKVIAQAKPLTPHQRQRLSEVLAPTGTTPGTGTAAPRRRRPPAACQLRTPR